MQHSSFWFPDDNLQGKYPLRYGRRIQTDISQMLCATSRGFTCITTTRNLRHLRSSLSVASGLLFF